MARSPARHAATRAVRPVRWGSLRRLEPVDGGGGAGRGTPIDRYYVSRFIERHAADVGGRVLEFREAHYAPAHGHDVKRVDVLDADPMNDSATVIADLGEPASLPEAAFDCVLVAGGLRYAPDPETAIGAAWDSVAPGGVLLFAVPALAPAQDDVLGPDRWRALPASLRELLQRACPGAETEVMVFGNLVTALALLQGLAAEDLRPAELDASDARYPVLLAARVAKTERS